jgi:hypothetical protein
MPKSRVKSGHSKNVAAATPPIPLLDSLRAQMQPSGAKNNDNESDLDNFKVSKSGWQCDIDDWSDQNPSNNSPNTFPPTLRSIERKNEQAKNNFFPEHENKSAIKEQIHDRPKGISSDNIDISKLSLIVTDLITGKRDQSAYTDFLFILQHYSVHSSRDDHLEETIYHLIQSAVSFIRSNEQRFDPSKLKECYHQRHLFKTNSAQ